MIYYIEQHEMDVFILDNIIMIFYNNEWKPIVNHDVTTFYLSYKYEPF